MSSWIRQPVKTRPLLLFHFESLEPFTQRRGVMSQKNGDLSCVLVLTGLPTRGRARSYNLDHSGALTTSERTKKNFGRIACNPLKIDNLFFHMWVRSVDEVPNHLGFYVLSAGKQLPTFRKSIIPPSSRSGNPRRFGLCGWEYGGSTFLRHDLDCMAEKKEVLSTSNMLWTHYQSTRPNVAEELNF